MTKKILIHSSLISIIFLTSCKKDEFNKPEDFIANIQVCDSFGNTFAGLETHVFLSESSYNSGVADDIYNTTQEYFEVELSNSEKFFWIEVYAKDEDDNLIKINIDDKFALPSEYLSKIEKVDYTVTVIDPKINIYKILYEWSNIKSERYIDGTYVPWDEGSSVEPRPDVQFIITDVFQSPIYNNQRTFGRLSESVNIIIDDLDKEYEFLLIDNDNSNGYDLICSENFAFRTVAQKEIVGLPITGHSLNYTNSEYNYYTIYGSLDGNNDRPVVLYFKTLWN